MYPLSIRVAIDVGSTCHRVAVGLPDGKLLDEFDISHNASGFKEFFQHIERLEKRHQLQVAVAMEGYNGWARPLDGQILQHRKITAQNHGGQRKITGSVLTFQQNV